MSSHSVLLFHKSYLSGSSYSEKQRSAFSVFFRTVAFPETPIVMSTPQKRNNRVSITTCKRVSQHKAPLQVLPHIPPLNSLCIRFLRLLQLPSDKISDCGKDIAFHIRNRINCKPHANCHYISNCQTNEKGLKLSIGLRTTHHPVKRSQKQ